MPITSSAQEVVGAAAAEPFQQQHHLLMLPLNVTVMEAKMDPKVFQAQTRSFI